MLCFFVGQILLDTPYTSVDFIIIIFIFPFFFSPLFFFSIISWKNVAWNMITVLSLKKIHFFVS